MGSEIKAGWEDVWHTHVHRMRERVPVVVQAPEADAEGLEDEEGRQ